MLRCTPRMVKEAVFCSEILEFLGHLLKPPQVREFTTTLSAESTIKPLGWHSLIWAADNNPRLSICSPASRNGRLAFPSCWCSWAPCNCHCFSLLSAPLLKAFAPPLPLTKGGDIFCRLKKMSNLFGGLHVL